MFKKAVSIFPVLALMMLLNLNPSFAKNANSLQVKGSDTMVNLVQSWAEEFMKTQPKLFIAVTGGGSGTGLAGLINGSCEIAVSSREIKAQEIALAKKKNVDPKEFNRRQSFVFGYTPPYNMTGQPSLSLPLAQGHASLRPRRRLGACEQFLRRS